MSSHVCRLSALPDSAVGGLQPGILALIVLVRQSRTYHQSVTVLQLRNSNSNTCTVFPCYNLLFQFVAPIGSKDCTITLDVDWRAPCFRSFTLRNLPTTFPGCALKYLGQAELGRLKVKRLSQAFQNAIPILILQWTSKSNSEKLRLTAR